MKKNILRFAILAALFPVFITSCSKDDDEDSATCTCIQEYDDGKDWERTEQVLDPSSFGAKNCSELTVKLRMAASDEYYYECW